MTTTDLPERLKPCPDELRALLERIQENNRPLPWVVHTGCSYRRIASVPTAENGYRSFPDGNVLHAYRSVSDGHPDLSMGEDQLTALVAIVNALPALIEREQRLGDSWQLIDSAPKDGTWIDLWKVAPDGIHGKRIADCKWDNNRSFSSGIGRVAQPDAWVHRHGGEVWLDGGRFSHWRPQPDAPARTALGDQT